MFEVGDMIQVNLSDSHTKTIRYGVITSIDQNHYWIHWLHSDKQAYHTNHFLKEWCLKVTNNNDL